MKKACTLAFAVLFAGLLAACASSFREAPLAYDLGPMRAERVTLLPGSPPFLLTEVLAPEWLDGTVMHYRLAYANPQEARSYAQSRWSMPPAKLIEQRLKASIAAAGGAVLPANNCVSNGIVLRVELDDFSHRFDSANKSVAQVRLRLSAMKGNKLLGQKTFVRTAPAASADAVGGAKALAAATDELIDDALAWLSGLASNG